MRGILQGPWGPIVLAMGLAILATPIVAIGVVNTGSSAYYSVPEPAFADALLLAGVASLVAAMVGGGVAGTILRRHATVGPLVAIGLAWPTAVILVPQLARIFGIRYQAVAFCFDTCQVLIDSGKALSGLAAVAGTLQVGVGTIIPDLVLLAALWAANRAARDGARGVAASLVVGGFAVLNWPAFAFGGTTAILPFFALAVGVIIWASVLAEPLPVRPAPLAPDTRPA